jgi:hypothetical protein
MLCPVCGRSDGLCDCLVATAPGQANDGADVAGPASGLGMAAPSQDWADTLLQFVRDFSAASPHVAPPATPAQSGRNGPVGRGSADLDHGDQGALATASQSLSPVGQTGAADNVSGSSPASAAIALPTPASAGSPSTSSAPAPPLRIAPFVTAPATEEGVQDRPSASSGSAARPGTTNSAWSGGEFEWHPTEVPGRSQ